MKTQIYGVGGELYEPFGYRRLFECCPPMGDEIYCMAWNDFNRKRENGGSADSPTRSCPKPRGEADFTWMKGEVYSDVGYGQSVYGKMNAQGTYDYEVRYNPSPDVLEWMAEKDCNYLTRIEKEGRLGELEPAVWLLWARERVAGTSIRQWWREKLKRTDLPQLLDRAEQEAQHIIGPVIERAGSIVETIQRNTITRLDQLAMIHALKSVSFLTTIFQALKTNTSVTTLDLSDMNLKLDAAVWQELAAALAVNSTITEINLSNTGLDQKTWEEILLPSLLNNPNLVTPPKIISTNNPCSFSYDSLQLATLLATRQLVKRPTEAATVTSALRKLIKNPGLVDLDLSNQPLTPEHMELICQIVATCPNLRTLNLSHTNLSYEVARQLLLGLSQHHSLQSIAIEGCALPKSIVLQLQAQVRFAGAKIIGAAGAMRDILPPREEERRKIIATVPAHFRCALTHKIMLDPVYAADGECYEREAIELWLQQHDTSPCTTEPMAHKNVCPSNRLKGEIMAFLQQQPLLINSDEIYLSRQLRQQFLQTIADNSVANFTALLQQEPRLLTCDLDDKKSTLLSCISRQKSVELLAAALEQLGDLFWQAPEIVGDSGMHFFREIALHMGLAGATVVAQKLAWGSEELAIQLGAIEAWPQQQFAESNTIAQICFTLWQQQEQLTATMLFHFIARYLHNGQFALAWIKTMIEQDKLQFMREAAAAQNQSGQNGLAAIAQAFATDANFNIELWQQLQLSAAELYKLLSCRDAGQESAAHIIARAQPQVIQYIAKILTPVELNQLLGITNQAGVSVFALIAQQQNSAVFREIIAKASPATICAIVGDKLLEFIATLPQSAEKQATVELLTAKYNFLANCQKLHQDLEQALQIITSGNFSADWRKQHEALIARYEQLVPHFATVLPESADEKTVQQLQTTWQQFHALFGLAQYLQTMSSSASGVAAASSASLPVLVSTSTIELNKPLLQQLLVKLLSSATSLTWQWSMDAEVQQLFLAALAEVISSRRLATRHFVLTANSTVLWNEIIKALPVDDDYSFSLCLAQSFNADVCLSQPSLTMLDLSDNPKQAKVILVNLKSQLSGDRGAIKLRDLKLNNIGLAQNSLPLLVELWQQLPNLTRLELRGNDFSKVAPNQFALFLDYIRTNPALRELDLRGSSITPQQIAGLARALLDGDLNLTTCLLDNDLSNVEQLRELEKVLQRNRDREQLEVQYQKMQQKHLELNRILSKLSLLQDLSQLVTLANAFMQQYKDNIAALNKFAEHDYPSPRLVAELRMQNTQDGALIVRLWAYIISKSSDLAAMGEYYAIAQKFYGTSLPQNEKVAAELVNAYVEQLLQKQLQVLPASDFTLFNQALELLNAISLNLVSQDNSNAFKKNVLAYVDFYAQKLSRTANIEEFIGMYYELLKLLNSSAFLLHTDKEEAAVRRGVYQVLLQSIVQYCQDDRMVKQTMHYEQLLELLHSMPYDYRATERVINALAKLAQGFIHEQLTAIMRSKRGFFASLGGLGEREIRGLLSEINKLIDASSSSATVRENVLGELSRLLLEFRSKNPRQVDKHPQFAKILDFLNAAIRYYTQPSAPSAPSLPEEATAATAKSGGEKSEESGVTARSAKLGLFTADQVVEPVEHTQEQLYGEAMSAAPSAASAPPLEMAEALTERRPIRDLLNKCAARGIDLSLQQIPEKFICPISLQIMEDPVINASGNIYERAKIAEWFATKDTDPCAREKVDNKALFPANDRRGEIISYLENLLRAHTDAASSVEGSRDLAAAPSALQSLC